MSSCQLNDEYDYPLRYNEIIVESISKNRSGSCDIQVSQKEKNKNRIYYRNRYIRDCPCNKWKIGDSIIFN